jgi:hypothetical protein
MNEPEEEEPSRIDGHVNAAEHWMMQADNWDFPHPARTECIQLASIHAGIAQALAVVEALTKAG